MKRKSNVPGSLIGAGAVCFVASIFVYVATGFESSHGVSSRFVVSAALLVVSCLLWMGGMRYENHLRRKDEEDRLHPKNNLDKIEREFYQVFGRKRDSRSQVGS